MTTVGSGRSRTTERKNQLAMHMEQKNGTGRDIPLFRWWSLHARSTWVPSPVCFHRRKLEGGVENCVHPWCAPSSSPSLDSEVVSQTRVNVLWHTTYASGTSSSLYHLQRLSRPTLMAGASDRYRSCLAICSQRVCSHSSVDIALVTVVSLSLEKACCASVTSCSVVSRLVGIEGLISQQHDNRAHTHPPTCNTSWINSSCIHSTFDISNCA